MATSLSGDHFRFLDLPRELRSRIYELLFFGCQNEQNLALTRAEPWQFREFHRPRIENARNINPVIPYISSTSFRYASSRIPVSIVMVNRQIQYEAEHTLYHRSTVVFFDDWRHFPYHFIERLPCRYREMIRNIEWRFFMGTGTARCRSSKWNDPFEWHISLLCLARTCPSLQSFRLWWINREETISMTLLPSQLDVRGSDAITRYREPSRGDMPLLWVDDKGGWSEIQEFPTRLERLRDSFRDFRIEASKHPKRNSRTFQQFNLLELPPEVRKRVYRHLLLPPNSQIHPYHQAWYDMTTRNVIPLFRTCRQVYREARECFYTLAIFTFRTSNCRSNIAAFFNRLPARLRKLVRHIRLHWQTHVFLDEKGRPPWPVNIQTVTTVLDDALFHDIDGTWDAYSKNLLETWMLELLPTVDNLLFERPGKELLNESNREWLEVGFVRSLEEKRQREAGIRRLRSRATSRSGQQIFSESLGSG